MRGSKRSPERDGHFTGGTKADENKRSIDWEKDMPMGKGWVGRPGKERVCSLHGE